MSNMELCPHCRQPMPKPAMTPPFARGYADALPCEYKNCEEISTFLINGRFLCYFHKVEVYGEGK